MELEFQTMPDDFVETLIGAGVDAWSNLSQHSKYHRSNTKFN